MNLWLKISLCGLFLLAVNACDDLDIPVPEVPQIPQIPRKVIQKSLITPISEKCPRSFVDALQDAINDVRRKHSADPLKVFFELSDYSLNSSRYYAKNDLLTVQVYKPPSAPRRYHHNELVFRKSQLVSSEYASGEKLIATAQEIVDSWMNKTNGRSASYEYDLYGVEPMDADAEKWEYFTQLVWKNTTEFGVSCVTTVRNFTLDSKLGVEDALNQTTSKIVLNVVVNFNYPGNRDCEYRINVLPPRDSENKAHQELLELDYNRQLDRTEPCKSRDDFYHTMTKCPRKYEEELLGLMNELRAKKGAKDLVLDRLNLGPFSQEYVNYLVSQSHEIIGNEPNNVHGGDIVWTPNNDTKGLVDSLHVKASLFMGLLTLQETAFQVNLQDDRELSADVAEQYKDYTRTIWKNTRKVGFGCGLAWLPGQGLTRPIVVANFYPQGNLIGLYRRNVMLNTDSADAHQEHELGEDENDMAAVRGEESDNETSPAKPKIEEKEEEGLGEAEVFE